MRLIGIDLDGTLEDSRDDMVAAARRVRAALGLPPRAAAASLIEVRVAYEADYLANVAVDTRLYDGIAGALAELARLGSLCCITNKPERISRQLLAALGVGPLFATVIGGDSCAHAKPH